MEVMRPNYPKSPIWMYRMLSYGFTIASLIILLLLLMGWVEESQRFTSTHPPGILALLPAILIIATVFSVFLVQYDFQRSSKLISISILCLAALLFFSEWIQGTLNLPRTNMSTLLSHHIPFQLHIVNISIILIISSITILAINRKHWSLSHAIATGFVIFLLYFITHFLLSIAEPISITIVSLTLLSAGLLCLFLEKEHAQHSGFTPYSTALLGSCMLITLSLLCIEIYTLEQTQTRQYPLTWFIAIAGSGLIALLTMLLHIWHKIIHQQRILQQSFKLNHTLLEAAADGIVAVDHLGKIIYYNESLLKMWKTFPSELLDIFQFCKYLELETNDAKYLGIKIRQSLQFNQPRLYEELLLDNGKVYLVKSQPQKYQGKTIGQVINFQDITQTKALEKSLNRKNTHDQLTQLPNRILLPELIQFALEANPHKQKVCIAILDIDRMAMINDVFGMMQGDTVIKTIAKRIQKHLPKNSSLCRFGGDEFAILLHHLPQSFTIKPLVEALVRKISQPMTILKTTFNLTFSVGMSVFPDHGRNKEDLLRMADIALNQAKKMGRKHIAMYSPQFNEHTLKQMQLENDLHVAIAKKQFILVYQPIFNLENLSIVGVEALIRWKHPKRGILLPDYFINLAEEINLIHPISQWVLNTACQQLAAWEKKGINNVKMAVNIAAPQFHQHKLLNTILDVLTSSGIQSDCLELELIERTLLEDNPETYTTLKALSQKGIHLTLDDFGTGYSSLSYLKRFPISKLKIDKSFILELIYSEENQTLVNAIISMAKSLKMKVLAEGIEDKEQLRFLQQSGCELGQGFYLAHPMLAQDCYLFMQKSRNTAILHQRN